MKITCEHCEEAINGRAYRVYSYDEDGSILLNMIVCEQCNDRAIRLGLRAEEVRPAVRRSRRATRAASFVPRMAV